MKPFHITCVMHNSRTSIRMFNYNVKNGIAEYLTLDEEEKLLEIICEHIQNYKLRIICFNICGDHIHFIINENPSKLNNIIGRLKSISAREFNIWRGLTIPNNNFKDTIIDPKEIYNSRGETQNSLWAQKFNRVEITHEVQFQNVLKYIAENRIKHELRPLSKNAIKIIESMISISNIQF